MRPGSRYLRFVWCRADWPPTRSSLPSCSRPSRTLRAAEAVARRRAILDRRCARRRRKSAVGAEERLRRGRTKESTKQERKRLRSWRRLENGRIDREHRRRLGDAGDRQHVAHEVEVEFFVEGGVDRVREIGDEQRVAVGG